MCRAFLDRSEQCSLLLPPVRAWIHDSRIEFRENYRHRLKRKSWLLNFLIYFFFGIYCFTPNWKLHVLFKRAKGYPWWHRNRYKIIEWYVITWSILIAILFFLLYPFSNSWFIWLFILFGACRLIDILQAWVSVNILATDPHPYSAPRMLVLNIISFSQIIVVYAGFAFLASKSFLPTISDEPIKSIWSGLYYSFTTITTMDSGFSPKGFLGHFLFYSQVSFGILFLVVVIQQVLSFYRK